MILSVIILDSVDTSTGTIDMDERMTLQLSIPNRETRDKLIALISLMRLDASGVICNLIDKAELPDNGKTDSPTPKKAT